MWIWLALGWIAGSASLYLYVYRTAGEAPNEECVECSLPECTECPYRQQAAAPSLRRVA